MKNVILYGELGRRFGKYHRLAVRNAGEAIRALKANYSGFEKFMLGSESAGMGFRVYVGRTALEEAAEVNNPSGDREAIRIIPVVMGSKSPWVRILIGSALVAAAIVGSTFLGPAAFGVGAMGASMIFGGVSQLLTKPPPTQTYTQNENKESYVFNGPVNTSVQGSCITVVYGRMIVGSKVISAGIESYEE